MSDPSIDSSVIAEIVRRAKRKAARLRDRIRDPAVGRDDLEQELFLRVWPRVARCHPNAKSLAALTATVVRREVARLLHERFAQKRDRRGLASLDAMGAGRACGDDASASLEPDADRRRRRLGEQDRSDLAADLQTVIAELPPDLGAALDGLKTESVSAVTRVMGVRRSTLDGRVRRLRRQFESADMDKYL
jgi:hypothetical protein